jgi:hypothetical protein
MEEKLFYLNNEGRNLFVHMHIPDGDQYNSYLFLNSILDEKKRSQKFQSDTARSLCKKGNLVLRFDYFGTEDSEGELYDFNLDTCIKDTFFMLDFIKSNFKCTSVNFLGLRMGGSLALISSKSVDLIKNLILIEPIVDGKRFLLEQRTRRKAFYKLNNVTIENEFLSLNGKIYEDHQGYLLSKEVICFMENINVNNIDLIDKKIFLFKLNSLFSGKTISLLKNKLSKNNDIKEYSINCKDFWASMEDIDTSELTENIIACHSQYIS